LVLAEPRPVSHERAEGTEFSVTHSFEYSEEFRRRIVQFQSGMEGFPNYAKFIANHLGGPQSRLMQFVHYLVPEIEYRCGNLDGMRVLDFGCGTGASTAALAARCKSVAAYDIDAEGLDICRMRLEEHGLESRVRILRAPSLEEVKDQIGRVDLVLMCGVVEHLPLTEANLRRTILRTLFEMLDDGGSLYIYDTPNRLWPYDFHTTGLLGIPWTKPGSVGAYEKAVRKGRYTDSPHFTPGPRGLEQCGAWGATYWELLEYLEGEDYACLNTLAGNNKHIDYLGGARSFRWFRVPFDFFVGLLARPLRIPITAWYPFLDNLVFVRTGGGADRGR
jgi:2-polyprenyl-3-methyl-5-hydroxy-6-metoxy-1,4-benzoquinol methylase